MFAAPAGFVGHEKQCRGRDLLGIAGPVVIGTVHHRHEHPGHVSENLADGRRHYEAGLTEFTGIPCTAPSAVGWRVRAITAPLAATRAACRRSLEPLVPAIDPHMSTAPQREMRCGHAACVLCHVIPSPLRILNS